MNQMERNQMMTLTITLRWLEALVARLDACHQRHKEHGTDIHQRKEGLGKD